MGLGRECVNIPWTKTHTVDHEGLLTCWSSTRWCGACWHTGWSACCLQRSLNLVCCFLDASPHSRNAGVLGIKRDGALLLENLGPEADICRVHCLLLNQAEAHECHFLIWWKAEGWDFLLNTNPSTEGLCWADHPVDWSDNGSFCSSFDLGCNTLWNRCIWQNAKTGCLCQLRDDVELLCCGFVLLSTMETRSLSSEEAAASGCPLLLSDLPWARSIFGEKATYCPIGKPAASVAALKKFYNETPSLPTPAMPCRWGDVANQLVRICQNL